MASTPATDDLKRKAADAALRHVHHDAVVGLGSGSTAAFFIEALGNAIASGNLTGVRGVPTSRASGSLAQRFGVPLTDPGSVAACDVVVDGADEVDEQLNLVKGLGGALLREKLVAQASKQRIIVVDDGKLVSRLGTRSPLPVEVTPWGLEWTRDAVSDIGSRAALRLTGDEPYVTDNANHILDLHFDQGIDDARAIKTRLDNLAGVVETGLFVGVADVVIVAGGDGVRVLKR